MSAVPLQVTSEVAYDLMHDHLDTILALLEGPLPRSEVQALLGSAAILDRMLRYGLLTSDGNNVHTVATVYQQLRQEGMMSFLGHYVLPALVNSDDPSNGFGTVSSEYLRLEPEQMVHLRSGPVQELFDELTTISEMPCTGEPSRMTVMVIGTSRVLPDNGDDNDRALRHLREAALQRAHPEEQNQAVLSQYLFLADGQRYSAAIQKLQSFLDALHESRAESIESASYHLTLASHWRCNSPAACERAVRYT